MSLNRITLDDLAACKNQMDSFSHASYASIAPMFNLSPSVACRGFQPMNIPHVALPFAAQNILFERGYTAIAIFGHPSLHENEHDRVGFLSFWLTGIIALFEGRLLDRPERTMPGTTGLSKGRIEHEIFVWGSIIVMVFDVKFKLTDGPEYANCIAQVMCELDSASYRNNHIDLQSFRVYAILTDSRVFQFFGYDGDSGTFFKDTPEDVSAACNNDLSGMEYLHAMPEMCNRIFGILLAGYISSTDAYEAKSAERAELGDNQPPSSSAPVPIQEPEVTGSIVSQPSAEHWSNAHQLAVQAQSEFVAAHKLYEERRMDDAEDGANSAVATLVRSVHDVPKENAPDPLQEARKVFRSRFTGIRPVDRSD